MAKLSYGSFTFTTPAATTLAAATPAKAAGTTTAGQLGEFTHVADNRLRYDGLVERAFAVFVSLALLKGAGGNTQATVHVYKNGVSAGSLAFTITNATDDLPLTWCGTILLDTNDYVELWLETDTGDDLTVRSGSMLVSVLG